MTRPFRAAVAGAVAAAFLVPMVRSGPAKASVHKNEIKGLAFNPDQMTIRAGDTAIGAIGVSGAPGGQFDDACARAAIAKIQDRLK